MTLSGNANFDTPQADGGGTFPQEIITASGSASRTTAWSRVQTNQVTIRPVAGGTAASSVNTTICSGFNVPFRPRWARLVFANDQASSWPVAAASFAVSSRYSAFSGRADLARNSADASDSTLWNVVTFNNGGSFAPTPFNQTAGSTAGITVPANPNSAAQYVHVCSDWMPIPNAPKRIDGIPGYLLFVHVFGGASAGTRYIQSVLNPLSSMNSNFGAGYIAGDAASTAQNSNSTVLGLQSCYGIQVIGDAPGATIMCVGDSIQSCQGSSGATTGMGLVTTKALLDLGFNASHLEECVSGRKSQDFIPNGYVAMRDLKPDLVFIQVISENDIEAAPTQATVDACTGRAMALASFVSSFGKTPVLLTAAPFYTGTGGSGNAHEPLRVASNTAVRSLDAQGAIVVDIDALLSTAPNSGTYGAGLGYADGIHPNDAGVAACVFGTAQYPGYLSVAKAAFGLA